MANQVATGLALSIFGVGLSRVRRQPASSASRCSRLPPLAHPGCSATSRCSAPRCSTSMRWSTSRGCCSSAVAWFLYRTAAGLIAARRRRIARRPAHCDRLPGDRASATRRRCSAARWRASAAPILSRVYTPLWVEGMTAGRGWIALALVVFATWRPARVLVGAYLFGGVTIVQLFAQGAGADRRRRRSSCRSLPYLATIVVLVIISRDCEPIRLNAPASLGQPSIPDALTHESLVQGEQAMSITRRTVLRRPHARRDRGTAPRRWPGCPALRAGAAQGRLRLREPDRRRRLDLPARPRPQGDGEGARRQGDDQVRRERARRRRRRARHPRAGRERPRS